MSNELSDFKIIGGNADGSDFEFTPSDYTNYNVLSYLTEPSRDNVFELNADTLTYKYIPKVEITINLMKIADYMTFIKAINKPKFFVDYYDIEVKKVVRRAMYCSDKSVSDVWNNGLVVKGVKTVKATFVCLFGYSDYDELENASFTSKQTNSKLTARIYFAKPDLTIGSITSSSFNGLSADSDLSQISRIHLGSRMYIIGSALLDGELLGKDYTGAILTSSVSKSTISESKDYEFSTSPTITLSVSGSGSIFLRYDYRLNEFATRVSVVEGDGTTKTITSTDNLMAIPVSSGTNVITIIAWNKPSRFARITTITSEVIADYRTTDLLTSFNMKTMATDEVGSAQYGLKLSNASITIYDKDGLIANMAEEGYMTGSTAVELYLTETSKAEPTADDLIGFYYTSTWSYESSSYDKKISIELTDVLDVLNNSKIQSYAVDTLTENTGEGLFKYIANLIYNVVGSKNSLTDYPLMTYDVSNVYITDYSDTIFNFVSCYGRLGLVYYYSDGKGNIKKLEGE